MYITTQQQLQALVKQLRGTPLLAVDTEFIRENSYYPKLEIIQIATPEVEAIIDFRAVRRLTSFSQILNDPATVKVFHAGGQDLEIFLNLTQSVPKPLFDTQVAAAMVGLGAQVGYARLVEELLHISVDKSQTMTNWSRRPLSDSQIEYALEDVRHLLPIYKILQTKLAKMGRIDWLQEEWEAMSDPDSYRRVHPREAYRRVKGMNHLKPYQLVVLRELGEWREREAIARNRVAGRIVPDYVLLQIARRQPTSRKGLSEIRGLYPRQIERHGQVMLAVIKQAQQLPRQEWPLLARRAKSLTPEEDSLVALMQSWLRARAKQVDIAPHYLSTTAQLKNLVIASPSERVRLPVLRGWRRKLVGDDLLAIIEGDAGLSWDPKTKRLQLIRHYIDLLEE
ncbi:MAG: ribonuclease D [Ardenticatenaceae bacterium]